jgi:hypothetical protein
MGKPARFEAHTTRTASAAWSSAPPAVVAVTGSAMGRPRSIPRGSLGQPLGSDVRSIASSLSRAALAALRVVEPHAPGSLLGASSVMSMMRMNVRPVPSAKQNEAIVGRKAQARAVQNMGIATQENQR